MNINHILLFVGSISAPANALADNEPIQQIEDAQPMNPNMVGLRKMLFFDPRLSKSGFISFSSGHNLSMGGTDNLQTSFGHNWQQGPINSPTVLNSSMNFAHFWDGRAKVLKEQAAGPIATLKEMATHELTADVLPSIPQYRTRFQQLLGANKIDIGMVTTVIAVFEVTLITPNSRIDKWLKCDKL